MSVVEDQVRRLGAVEVPELPDPGELVGRGVRRRRRRHGKQGLLAVVVVAGLGWSLVAISGHRETAPSVSVDEPEMQQQPPTTPQEPPPTNPEATVTVPDVIGLTGVPARTAIESAGLVAAFDIPSAEESQAAGMVTGEVGSAYGETPVAVVVVVAQSPAAGSVVPAGSTVTLLVGGPTGTGGQEAWLSGERWTVAEHGGQLVATVDDAEVWHDAAWQGAPADPTYAPRRVDGPGIRVVFGRLRPPGDGLTMDVYLAGSDTPVHWVTGAAVNGTQLWAAEAPPGTDIEVVWRDADGNEQGRMAAYPLVPGT